MKPTGTGNQIATVIFRALPLNIRESPEGKLWFAVLKTALAGADLTSTLAHKDDQRFIMSDSFSMICGALGLDEGYCAEVIRDHAEWMRG